MTAAVYTIAGLARIQLPGHDILLCDGGFVDWPSVGTFVSKDPLFGTIEAIGSVTERVGDEAPQVDLTLQPPDISAASDLYRADAQNSPIHFWLADIDPETGAIIGSPELEFSGFVDTLRLRVGRDRRLVEMAAVSEAERLFWISEGNVMSSAFHQRVFAAETGLDQATGSQTSVPWGVNGPARGSVTIGSSGGGSGFDGARFNFSDDLR